MKNNVQGPLVFLDRDGTLIEEKHYLCDPAHVVLLPHVVAGLSLLKRLEAKLIMVSNQSGIGRGYYTEADLQAVNARMAELLAPHGIQLDAMYHCPHAPNQPCTCRKPATGMVQQAIQEHGYRLNNTFVIGDKACDLELGLAINAQSILVQTGHKASPATKHLAHFVATDLLQAAQWIEGKQDTNNTSI